MSTGHMRHSGLLDKKYKEFFIPTVLTSMATTMSIVVDSIIVGNLLGASALAAVNLVMPILMGYMTIAVFFGMGAATAISVAKGKRQDTYANDTFTVALIAMVLVSSILTVFQIIFIDDLSRILTKEPVLLPLVKSFLQVLIFGTPLLIVIPGMVYCLRTDGKVQLASMILIIANVVNLALDLIYIGVFNMGIEGSSLATISGYAIGACVLCTYIFAKDRTLRFNYILLKKPLILLRHTGQILKTGSPAALSSILMTFKILAINTIVLSVAGRVGMVAFSVCMSCLSFISMFISGAAQAMTPILGTLYGEKDYLGIRFVVKRAIQVLLATSFVAVIILELSPDLILTLFGVHDPADHVVGIPAVRIFALSLIGTSMSYLALYYYMTIGKRRIANSISIVQGFAIVIPAAFVLSKLFGATGVWLAFILAEITTLTMILAYSLYMRNKYPKKYHDALLLDAEDGIPDKTLELTMRNTMADYQDVLKTILEFLRQNWAEPELCNKTQVVVREMITNITKHGFQGDKKSYIDLRITMQNVAINIMIRDAGCFFNPSDYLDNLNEKTLPTSGIALVQSVVTQMEYSRVIGLNTTTMRLQTDV